MVTVPHKMVGLERMSDYRGVGLQRFHCIVPLWRIWSIQLSAPGGHLSILNPNALTIRVCRVKKDKTEH